MSMVLLMNYNHPYTSNARSYFVSTPIITNVSSQVTEIYVKEKTHVKKGDTLFILDNTVFKSKVSVLYADLSLARTRLNQSRRLLKARAGSAYDVQLYEAEINQINAKLIEAQWRVNECVVTAPTDGLITQTRLRVGMRAVEFPLKPLMSFVSTDKKYIIAALPQNPMQRIAIGNEAEIIFDAVPGEIIKGEIINIGEVIVQGELQASGTLYNFDQVSVQGSIPVLVEITSDVSGFFIPGGAKAQVAIYSDHMEPVKIIRRMLLRMKGWLNYVFGEH
jgi:multidrug resistance efflux pump